VTWSPTQGKVAGLFEDNSTAFLKIWNSSGSVAMSQSAGIDAPYGSLLSIDWCGSKIAAGGELKKTLYYWNSSNGSVSDTSVNEINEIYSVAWAKDCSKLAVGGHIQTSQNKIAFFNSNGSFDEYVSIPGSDVYSLDWSPDSSMLAIATNQGNMTRIYDLSMNALYELEDSGRDSVAWSTTNLIAVLGGGNLHVYAPFDDSVPDVAIETPNPNASTDQPSVLVTGTASDPSGIVQVEYQVSGGPMIDMAIEKGGTFGFDAQLQDGYNNIVVTAVDLAGNEGHASVKVYKSFVEPCTPACDGKECGPDGCDGQCPPGCAEGEICIGGICLETCEPDCAGKECGDDGCGGSCGDCPGAEECMMGECSCVPSCVGKQCGDNGCGGSCGECLGQYECEDYECKCMPECLGKECGSDGCGGSCGACACGHFCDWGVCSFIACNGKDCGDDGCGGSCGECGEGMSCLQHHCVDDYCAEVGIHGCCDGSVVKVCETGELVETDCSTEGDGLVCGWVEDLGQYTCTDEALADPSGTVPMDCPACIPTCEGKDCGPDGCGGTCGECGEGGLCQDGVCCYPNCQNKECGPDGCGGTCGECGEGEECIDGLCETICVPDCAEAQCGDDGCGGSCGDCAVGQLCEEGQCVADPCGGVGYQGCCIGELLKWCDDGVLKTADCSGKPHCGWSAAGYYDCETDGFEDPSGEYPLECPACEPECEGKECGSDNCGGLCGDCGDGKVCSLDGLCIDDATVEPDIVAPETTEGPTDTGTTPGQQDAVTVGPQPSGGGENGCSVGGGQADSARLPLLVLLGCLASALEWTRRRRRFPQVSQ